MVSDSTTLKTDFGDIVFDYDGGTRKDCDFVFLVKLPLTMAQKDDITCFLCQKVFRRKSDLNMHREAVHEIDVQQCTLCQKEFKNRKVLSVHFRNMHRKYTCKECKLDFENYKEKYHHVKAAHEETDRICNICGSMFEANYLMKRHMERTCSSQRTRKREWNMRSGKLHSPEGGYCEKCDKTFKTLRSFQMHKNLHALSPTQAKCMICPAQYAYPIGLRRHYRNAHNVPKEHTWVLVPIIRQEGKEKMYIGQRKACKRCGKGFNKTKLARHTKICTAKKEAQPSVENILASALPLQSYIQKSTKYVEKVSVVKNPPTHTTLENTALENTALEKTALEKTALENIAHASTNSKQESIAPQNLAKTKIAVENISDVVADIATDKNTIDQDVKGDQFYPEILYSSKSKEELAAELGLDDAVINRFVS